MRTEDGHIISKCLNGDSAAFGLLVDKYKASIYALAYSKLRNFHDAEDVTQDVFLTAYQKLRTLRQWDSFLAWLHAMTLNACKLKMRERSRRPDQEFIEDKDPKTLKVLSIAAYREERLDESLQDALDSLPEMYRQVLTLYYLGGMSGKEIALFLRVSPATVRQRLGRARSKLKKEMHSMMSAEFEDRKLQATFTFRIVEAVKRLKIQPLPRMTGIPWGLSLAAGLILAAIGLSSHLNIFNPMAIPAGSPLPGEAKMPKTGEMPVEILDASKVSFIASKQMDGDSGRSETPRKVLLLAPKAAGGKWSPKSDMPTARCGLTTCAVNGKVYAIGGGLGLGKIFTTVEEYDTATDTWIPKADMLTARGWLSASVVKGRIYAIGGWNTSESFLLPVEEYDPITDTWIKKADMPTGRDGLSTSAVNGKVYAIGGINNSGWLPSVEEYDPITDTWAKKADMPTARWGLSTSVVNGKIYAIGGRTGIKDIGIAFPAVEEYDPVKNTWAKKSDMPTARWGLSTGVVRGEIYAIGGSQDESTALSVVEIYDPVTDTWTDGPDIPTARWYLSSSVIGGKIYAIGGWTANSVSNSSVEEYDTGSGTVEAEGKHSITWGEIKSD